jgi:hypothetical protein
MDFETTNQLHGGTIAADFYLPPDWREGRGLQYLLWQSGWVRLIDARRESTVGQQQRLLVACVDDYGRRVPSWRAHSFFGLPASLPKEVDELVPEDQLEPIGDDMALGFLVDTDRILADELSRRRDSYAAMVARLETQYMEGLQLLEEYRNRHRRARLLAGIPISAVVDTSASLELQLEDAFRLEQARLRQQHESIQEQLFADMELDPSLDVVCTVRWRLLPATRPRSTVSPPLIEGTTKW